MNRPGPALVSVRDMAVSLFGRNTVGTCDAVRRMAKRGQIASVRDGRKWWIPASEIDRMRNLTVENIGAKNDTTD